MLFSGITDSRRVFMQLLVLEPLQLLPFSEWRQLVQLEMEQQASLSCATTLSSIAAQLEKLSQCEHIQFFAVTDGAVTAAVGVAHNNLRLSNPCCRVKSGWLMRTSQLLKIPLRESCSSPSHCWSKRLLKISLPEITTRVV